MFAWLLPPPIALLVLGVVAGKILSRRTVAPGARWPAEAVQFRSIIEGASTRHAIPVPVLLAWIWRESRFRPDVYNPESAYAMERWACAVADDPRKWGANPDYADTAEVCRRLRAGESRVSVLPLWRLGSTGLMQVMRIVASEAGGLPYDRPASVLFDPATNIEVGCRVVSYYRRRLYGTRMTLNAGEWAWVRAAYAGGVGILTQRPERAREIAEEFLGTLREMSG